MKLCINCHILNADDADCCSGCGMGLTRMHAEETRPVDSADRGGTDGLAIARFMWGWVLLGVGVPAAAVVLFLLLSSPLRLDSRAFRESLILLFVPTLDAGLGAWMVWSVARRIGSWEARTRTLVWAGGPLAGAAVAAAWLAGVALVFFTAFKYLDCTGPDCGPGLFQSLGILALGILALGSLFVAPLVGAVIVVVDWRRRSSRNSRVVLGSR